MLKNYRKLYKMLENARKSKKMLENVRNKMLQIAKQAGAELCQAQVKMGLATIAIFFHLMGICDQ